MNVELNGLQSDTKEGAFGLPDSSAGALLGKENVLLYVTNATVSGVVQAQFAIPTSAATAALATFVCMSGDFEINAAGQQVTFAESPNPGDQCRILLDGTCNPGDPLSASLLGTYGTNWGYITKPPASTGAVTCRWVALEAGVQGQYLKVVRIGETSVTF